MKILLKSVKIIDKKSTFNQQIKDILIVDGTIGQIDDTISIQADHIIKGNNLHVSAAWIDMRVQACNPGYEAKEEISTLLKAATVGGFSQLLTLPNSKPVIEHKEAIAYYKQLNTHNSVTILAAAAITKNCDGHDFTEMYDLHKAGAVAFSDGNKSLWNADILLKTLQYLSPIGALLMNRPEEPTLAQLGQMHEGICSTRLGMKGIPAAAEELMIMRDLKLLEYSDIISDHPILHFSMISTTKSVDLIRDAKKKGLPVSCDIAAHQLAFTDDDLESFDTNLKVNPPFRTADDITALQKGLADGTIDVIVSDHSPQDEESKNLEFDLAEFGIIGLETAFAVANTYSKLPIEQLIEKFTDNPRKLLKQALSGIEKGSIATFTVFNPDLDWVFRATDIQSKSKNTPFINKKLKGKVISVVINGQLS